MTTATAPAPAAPSLSAVERLRAISVAARLTHRQHVESCPRAYYGSPCITCEGLHDAAGVADWQLFVAREAAAI